MPPSILSQTRNFFSLYTHAAGTFHTPRAFHWWAALSLLCAAAGDRLYLMRFRHAPLYPNLFVFLVGASGLGKDHATGFARSLVTPAVAEYIQPFAGKITQAHLSDVLEANQRRKDRPAGETGAATWLIQSELFADLPGGELTKQLVADLVRLYSGGGSPIMLNATRMHGERIANTPPVINWLAGSTPEWFSKAITPDIFDSGFSGRSIFVYEKRNYEQRYPEPIYPDDYEEIVKHLKARIGIVCHTKGEMHLSSRATEIDRAWVYNRPAPRDETEAKLWDRQQATSLKIAMALTLADSTASLTIPAAHIEEAQRIVSSMTANTMRIAESVHTTAEVAVLNRVRNSIRRAGRFHHTSLLRIIARYGGNRERVRDCVQQLHEQGDISMETTPKGALVYVWQGEPEPA